MEQSQIKIFISLDDFVSDCIYNLPFWKHCANIFNLNFTEKNSQGIEVDHILCVLCSILTEIIKLHVGGELNKGSKISRQPLNLYAIVRHK